MIGALSTSKPFETYSSSHLLAAGLTQRGCAQDRAADNTCAKALNWSSGQRPETPRKLKKYRQSTLHTPGEIFRHYGAADDPVDTARTYGRVSKKHDSTASCFHTYPESDMMRWTLDRAEDVYHSSTREPLGKSWVRGYKLPPGMGTVVPFGQQTNAKQNSAVSQARQAVAPVDAEYDDTDEPRTQAHALHVRSHGAYAPGEQRRRPYSWEAAGIDPDSFRFGATDKVNFTNGVGKALNPALDAAANKELAIVPKRVEDHNLKSGNMLSQSRKLGVGDRCLPDGYTFGKPSLAKGREDGVFMRLHGHYSLQEQTPDADLGRSLREGYRNCTVPDRTFGVPSVRLDLPEPHVTSVANMQNFGNEPNAFSLLAPCSTADRGVNEVHFLQRHDRDAITALLCDADITMDRELFGRCFAASAQAEGDRDRTSLKCFMDTRHGMLRQQAGL